MTRHSSKQAVLLLTGLATGLAGGVIANSLGGESEGLAFFVRNVSEPTGKIFLRLLLMLVIPLLVSAIAIGIAGMPMRALGRLGLATLAYTVVLSSISVFIGVALVQVFRPGEQAGLVVAHMAALPLDMPPPQPAVDFFVGLVPDNVVAAMAQGNIIGVIVFAVFLGVGLSLAHTPATARLRELLEGLFDVSMRLIRVVIALAPIGVAALVFTATSRLGLAALRGLAAYVGVVLLALALHQFGVYSLAVRFLGGMQPWDFFRKIRLAMLTAFSTASSNATLPTALQVADEELHLPKPVSRFVLTVGATMNQNGTALFEGVTVLFLAQLAGVQLGLGQQILVVVVCVLGGIGTAGVPAGSIPVVMMILSAIGVPPDGIGLVLGVDRFLDMCRTTLNVTGDLAAAVVISNSRAGRAAVEQAEQST